VNLKKPVFAEVKMLFDLELNCGERIFINYYDSLGGNDVVCEVAGDKIIHEGTEISFADFIKLIKKSSEETEKWNIG
jgi:hypothetical protein